MASPIDQAKNYFDLNALNSIRTQSNKADEAAQEDALNAAAKQFEAIFMQMLLKSMRQAQEVLESDSPFNSQSTKFYRDMHDQQLAVELSDNGSLGLSDLIVRQLGGDSDNFTPSSVLRSDGNINDVKAKLKQQFEQLKVEQSDSDRPFGELIDIVKENPTFENPEDFVQQMALPAKNIEQKTGIPYQVVIAQSALETGWGQKIIKDPSGQSSNNLFNIKADKRWGGEAVQKETLEFEQGAMVKKVEPFRAYNSLSESANDFANFISTSPRYQKALGAVSNVEQFLNELQGAGYATDPNYAQKILNTLKRVSSFVK